jgi:hypothetical protein
MVIEREMKGDELQEVYQNRLIQDLDSLEEESERK